MMIDSVKIIARPTASCDYHRLILPYGELGYDFTIKKTVQECKLLIFSRLTDFTPEILLNVKKKFGFKYIVDIDDYWFLNKEHYLYKSYQERNTARKIIETIKHADCVTTTTAKLADEIKSVNKNVYIIPNALPFGKLQFTKQSNKSTKEIKFIYAGGISHYNDLRLINEAVDNVDFTLAGYNKSHEEGIRIKSLFRNANIIESYALSEYMKCYDNADVSLAPLIDNNFNKYKSQLKVIEAGCKGLAAIAQKMLPYYNDIDKGIIDFCETKADWQKMIDFYSKNRSYVEEKKEQLAEHVRLHYSLDEANKTRTQLIEHLIS